MNRTRLLLAVVILVLLAGGVLYWRGDEPSAPSVKLVENASTAGQAAIRSEPATSSAQVSASPQYGETAPVTELKHERVQRLVDSPNPAERMQGYKMLAQCAFAQRTNPVMAQKSPGNASQLFLEMNQLCDGLTATLLAKRFSVIEELARSKYPGAAAANIQETPDGTSIDAARVDPNYQAWYRQALSLLESSAKAGDKESISSASGLFRTEPGREFDYLLYRVAELEVAKRTFPDSVAQFNAQVEMLSQVAQKNLSRERIQEAVSAGRALGASPQLGELSKQ